MSYATHAHKNAESENDQYLQAILKATNDGFCVIDSASRRILDVNDTYITMSGYTRDELLNLRISDIDAVEKPADTSLRIQLIFESGSKTFETRHRRKDGSEFDVELSVSYLPMHGGRFICFCRDITERNRTLHSLQASEKLLRNIIDSSADYIYVKDRSLRTILCNKTFAAAVGKRPADLIGKTDIENGWDPLFVKGDTEKGIRGFEQDDLKALSGEIVHVVDEPGNVSDAVRIFDTIKLPLYQENDEIVGVLGISRDISDRAEAVKLLKESNRFLENERMQLISIFDSIDEPIYVADLKTHELLFVNQALAKIIGKNPVGNICYRELQDRETPCDFCTNTILLRQNPKPYRWEHFNSMLNRTFVLHDRIIRWPDGRDVRLELAVDITERKRAEYRLENERNRLSHIVEGANVGTWEWNIQTGETIFNEKWAVLKGYTLDELSPVSDKTREFFTHPDDLQATEEMLQRHLSGELPCYDCEYRMRHKDGRWIWVHDRGRVITRTEDGRPLMMFGTHTDINDRKSAEEILQERETFLNVTSQMAKIGGWELYPETSEVTWTDQTYLIHEVPKSVKPPLEDAINFWHPEDQPILRKAIQQALEKGIPYDLELRFITAKGRHLYARTKCNPVIQNGKIVKLRGFFQDITDSKQAQLALEAEKEQLLVTLRSIGDGVITTDINGNVVLMNEVAEELTGWKQEEAQGKSLLSVFTIINESTREPHENPVQKVLITGDIIELANHTLLISRDGSERVIADSGAPIKDANHHIIGVVLVFRDMTEKQRFLEITQNSQKLESLGVLAGGIAHDFNNLLGGIYGFIDMAAGESANNEMASQHLSKAVNTIDRARDLTRQLLTFSKGGAPVQKTERLSPFIQETVKFALSGSNATCHFDVHKDLWACNFDKNQIGQVIDNLVINAQQAMPTGGSITVTARNITISEKEHPILSKGNYVRISIKDTGIGMPREMLVRIFDPFFTTKPKGHGLGLATCYSIINRHNGCIDVDSEPGKGSVFNVYLPAVKKNAGGDSKKTMGKHKGSGTFLVMDDEEVMRETIGNMLESFGYSVVCKDNGKDALDYLAAESEANRSVSGVIFDLTIPGGMGGKEAIAEIRRLNAKIPVFVASGYADGPVMKNPAEYGFTASICKPFRRIELMEMLERHMKTRR